MTKAKLRQRVLDICVGAGMKWMKDGYFEDFSMEGMGNAVAAFEIAFDLHEKNRLRNPLYWDSFDDLDSMVELVSDAIEHGTEE